MPEPFDFEAMRQRMVDGMQIQLGPDLPPEMREQRAREESDRMCRELAKERRLSRIRACRIPITASDERMLIDDALTETRCLRAVREWLESSDPRPWLFLSGTVGRGKTVAASWALIRGNNGSGYISGRELERVFTARYGDEIKTQESVLNAPTLVVDDIGRERDAASMTAALLDVVDYRRSAHDRTIAITNLTRQQFNERYADERLVSRLSECALWITDKGEDLRRRK